MNWIKQNKKLATILAIMIVGGIGLGVWLYLAWSDYTGKMDEWTQLDRKAATLENAKIYPSESNMKSLAAKIADYRGKFDILQTTLLSKGLQEEETPITETDFQAKLKEVSRAVGQKAEKMGIPKDGLPKDFALGFEEYTGTLPPSAETAKELNVQLDAAGKFVNILLDAGVKSIDSLKRTKLASERGGAPPPAPKPVPPPPQRGNQRNKPVAAPVVKVVPVLDKQTFECAFTCDQGPLQTVINNLANPAKTPDFLVVRQLHVENMKQEAPTKDEVKQIITKASEGAQTTKPQEIAVKPVPGAPRVIPPVKPLAADAADIMGGELLKVYVEVDYVRFRQVAADDAAAPSTK